MGVEFEAGAVGVSAFAFDGFAFAGVQGGKEVVETGIILVLPVVLNSQALQPADRAQGLVFLFGAEGGVDGA
jgi:hypothetical protein